MRQTQQKLLGIIGQQDGTALVLRQRDQLGLGLTRHHDGAGTRLDGTGSKIIAVDVFTGKGDENRPFLDLARVDNAPAHTRSASPVTVRAPVAAARLLTAISIIAAPL